MQDPAINSTDIRERWREAHGLHILMLLARAYRLLRRMQNDTLLFSLFKTTCQYHSWANNLLNNFWILASYQPKWEKDPTFSMACLDFSVILWLFIIFVFIEKKVWIHKRSHTPALAFAHINWNSLNKHFCGYSARSGLVRPWAEHQKVARNWIP